MFRERIATVQYIATVSTNRAADVLDGHLPAALIGTPTDAIEKATKPFKDSASLEKRLLDVTVALVVEGGSEGLDDELDELRVGVEEAIAVDDDLGGIAKAVNHTGGGLDVMVDEEGERWYAILTLTWQVEVWTERGNPEVAT